MVKIIKEECVGCGVCADICPDGIEMVDGKAKIKDENADCLKEAANACPRKAIMIDEETDKKQELNNSSFGFGQGTGKGISRGFGRGLGPRDGRGMGRGRKW